MLSYVECLLLCTFSIRKSVTASSSNFFIQCMYDKNVFFDKHSRWMAMDAWESEENPP